MRLETGHARLGAPGRNLEERAREARHSFLNHAAASLGARYIALAHHADDQAETVLMRFMRGAGLDGLEGMAELGPGRLFRPLLTVYREEILAYLAQIGASYVIDSSNQVPSAMRNRVRLELLPLLEREYAPGLSRRLAGLANQIGSLANWLSSQTAQALSRSADSDGALDIAAFNELHPALAVAVMREYLRSRLSSLRRVGRPHIDALMRLVNDGPSNGAADLPGGLRARRDYGRLRIEQRSVGEGERCDYEHKLARVGRTIVIEAGFGFKAESLGCVRPGRRPDSDRFEAWFDADRLGGTIAVRSFRPGDRISPAGIDGSRKVKRIFIDHKVPPAERQRYPLVVVNDQIGWIPGLMRGSVALLDGGTRRVLRLSAYRLQDDKALIARDRKRMLT
jgi:tRNA(Ile)-lysidine synthase